MGYNSFGNICSVALDKTGKKLVAVDDVTFLKIKHRGSDIIIVDSTGRIEPRLRRSGFYDGQKCWYMMWQLTKISVFILETYLEIEYRSLRKSPLSEGEA